MKGTRTADPTGGQGSVLSPASAERISAHLRRGARTIELRPERATGTAVTRVRVDEGMRCQVLEGNWELVVDLPERWGGTDRGPNPGVLGRGALGACLSMAYLRWAADAGLVVDGLEIEIQADYDARGELGLADVTPAYGEVRYAVDVRSPAPPSEVRRVFELAEERCPYLKVFADPIPMRRELRITDPSAGGTAGGGDL